VIGPYFFENSVTGVSYLNLLEEYVYPEILNHPGFNEAIWQQDGAPGHYATIVRNWLDFNFPKKWIGRRGPIEWPPRSPDLTPLDFFLWGYLKSEVYKDRPRTLDDLKTNIINTCNGVTKQMLSNTRKEWESRLKHCITAD